MIGIARNKARALPIKVPNPGLIEAMEEAEAIAADGRRFSSAEDLFNSLEEAARG